MRKNQGLLCATAAALIVAGAADVRAACGGSVLFGQGGDGGSGYSYVTSPGSNDISASLVGAWWAVGTGNPNNGAGNDSGGTATDVWLRPYGGSFYMAGDWVNPGSDGCIADAGFPVMVTVFGDQSADGSAGYFAIAGVDNSHDQFALTYDFAFVNGGPPQDIALVPIPAPAVTALGDGANPNFQVTWDQAAIDAGVYVDSSGAGETLITDVTVWYVNAAAEPTTRETSAWLMLSDLDGNPSDASADVEIPDAGPGEETWVALSVGYDSGYVSDYVGAATQVGAPAGGITVELECSCLARCPGAEVTYRVTGSNDSGVSGTVRVDITSPVSFPVLAPMSVAPGSYELRKNFALPGNQPPAAACPVTPTFTATASAGGDTATASCSPEFIVLN